MKIAACMRGRAVSRHERLRDFPKEQGLENRGNGFWHDVVVKSPHNGRGLMTYGITLVNNRDFAGALGYLRRAQEFTPPLFCSLD